MYEYCSHKYSFNNPRNHLWHIKNKNEAGISQRIWTDDNLKNLSNKKFISPKCKWKPKDKED